MEQSSEQSDLVRFVSDRCTITVDRVAPGTLVVRISGYDRGQFGSAPLDEVANEMSRYSPVNLFVDASEADGATWTVSEDWTRWFQMNRARLARVDILVRSRLVQQTVAVARELSRTGRLIAIYDDEARFERALDEALQENQSFRV